MDDDRLTELALKEFPAEPVANIVAALAIVKRENIAESDALDGMLFRFWTRAASEFPGDAAKAILACKTPSEYRAALIGLAHAKRINLPGVA